VIIRRLTIFYDAGCPVCVRCREWMEGQPAYVELAFIPRDTPHRWRLPPVGDELVVVSDGGEMWMGPAAFLVCLWALRDWREWSYRLSGPTLQPLAERFFHALSSKRGRIAAWLGWQPCPDGRCSVAAHPYR
jgi:hypothetical protein